MQRKRNISGITNREAVNDRLFQTACKLAGISPTKRQVSKWRNGKGLAHQYRNAAMLDMQEETSPNVA